MLAERGAWQPAMLAQAAQSRAAERSSGSELCCRSDALSAQVRSWPRRWLACIVADSTAAGTEAATAAEALLEAERAQKGSELRSVEAEVHGLRLEMARETAGREPHQKLSGLISRRPKSAHPFLFSWTDQHGS